nr:hypothetical protein [Tanacetum cinerariifolium]
HGKLLHQRLLNISCVAHTTAVGARERARDAVHIVEDAGRAKTRRASVAALRRPRRGAPAIGEDDAGVLHHQVEGATT